MNSPLRIFTAAACLLLPATLTRAHQVPSITVEAMFAADHTCTLRVNLDPRVFLSAQPASLPPVEAAWYLEQSEEEKKQTHLMAWDYLKKNFQISFSGRLADFPECVFTAIDGATLEPLLPATPETHLLAVAKSRVPDEAGDFVLAFGPEANVSLILLIGEEGRAGHRPQVLFPGETSRPHKIPQATAAVEGDAGETVSSTESSGSQAIAMAGLILLVLLLFTPAIRRRIASGAQTK
ncbi:MAG TPA: hypothetical protein DIT64_17330 [Verrucomicrobiales bacterium]|nr:hypothetical protein [Verrucomicrobiales bacterium]